MIDYQILNQQLTALIKDVPHPIANLANAAALLFHSLDHLNWAGFYLLEGETLVLGPFQGKPACIEIPMGKGVCGTAAATGQTQLVPDVRLYPGHIPCDNASRSEFVTPLYKDGCLLGVLDLDSPVPGRFSETDRTGLEQFAHIEEIAL